MKILLKTVQALALRSRIVLACSDGADNGTVAVTLAVTQQTVYEWRDRFLKERLRGLRDAPRSGCRARIDDACVEAIFIEAWVPSALDIHLAMDNCGTHKTLTIRSVCASSQFQGPFHSEPGFTAEAGRMPVQAGPLPATTICKFPFPGKGRFQELAQHNLT